MDQRPIGIFDSGIGGLTVAREINAALPNEQLIYFGDTAHFPYGDKERSSILRYSTEIAKFLIEQDCKAIVIACNTASASSLGILREQLPEGFPLYDVIRPVVEHVSVNYSNKLVGIIATKGTTNSRVYPKLIKLANKNIEVTSLATPLLAPMIEEGFFNNNISSSIIASYLNKKNLLPIQALVLACTHYPIIEKEIKKLYKKTSKNIDVINSAKIVATSISKNLNEKDLLATNLTSEHLFYISDFTESFQESSQIFFGKSIKLQKLHLWK